MIDMFAKKQDENVARFAVTAEQTSMALQKPIDLSCHEMDVSVDFGNMPADSENIDCDMGDSQGELTDE